MAVGLGVRCRGERMDCVDQSSRKGVEDKEDRGQRVHDRYSRRSREIQHADVDEDYDGLVLKILMISNE